MSAPIRVSEIFGPTIQGEGTLIGRPTVFIRTGGCDYRCAWCDSLHAVESAFRHTWTPMTPEAALAEVERLSGGRPALVTLSGGNPALQPLGPLIRAGRARGHRFALETQATHAPGWLSLLDHLVLSPKPPSSGMVWAVEALRPCLEAAGDGPDIVLKFVVFDEADYRFARETARAWPDLPVCLQPGNHTPPPPEEADAPVDLDGIAARMTWLVARTLEDHWPDVRVLPQLHVMLWGNRRGV